MKILATGDFHLGAGADYGARPGERLADQHVVLEQIVNLALEHDVDAVLFAGDAFERRTPTPAELMVWRSFVTQLRDERVPLFSIAGNHDVAGVDLPTGMEVVGSTGRSPGIAYLASELSIATLPWVPVARMVAAEGGGDRDAQHERAANYLLETARGLRAKIKGTAILLAHWSVSGASLPNGLPTDDLREVVLELETLEGLGFDRVVLGHIHKQQLLGDGTAFYVGSPMPLNFGEARDEHGVWIIDTEERFDTSRHRWDVTHFIPIASRRFVTIEADLTSDPLELASALTRPEPVLADAIVRVRYKASAEQARRVDQAELRERVLAAGAHKLYAIQPDIVRTGRARVEVDESVDELLAFDLWLESQDLNGDAGALASARHADYIEEAS